MAADISTAAPRIDKVTGQIIQQKMLTWSFGLATRELIYLVPTKIYASGRPSATLIGWVTDATGFTVNYRVEIYLRALIFCVPYPEFISVYCKTCGCAEHAAKTLLRSLTVYSIFYPLVRDTWPFIDTFVPLMLTRPTATAASVCWSAPAHPEHLVLIWSPNIGWFGTVNNLKTCIFNVGASWIEFLPVWNHSGRLVIFVVFWFLPSSPMTS